MYQLGGYPMYLSANDMQIGRGEPIGRYPKECYPTIFGRNYDSYF